MTQSLGFTLAPLWRNIAQATPAGTFSRQVEGSQGAKLRVRFFRPFHGDYWILARKPTLDGATLQALLAQAAALGFDRQVFLRTSPTPTGNY